MNINVLEISSGEKLEELFRKNKRQLPKPVRIILKNVGSLLVLRLALSVQWEI